MTASPAPSTTIEGFEVVGPSPDVRHPSFANAMWQVARKDVMQHIRTKRVLIIAAFMLATLVLVTYILPIHVFHAERLGDLGPEYPNQAMSFYLAASVFGGAFVIQLLAIIITSDAVSSEWSHRTVFLLLSKPVSRTAFVLGKFLGSVLTVVPTFVALMLLDYLFLAAISETPGGKEWGLFLQALGILALGATAVTAVALFFSTLTRSSITGMILSLAMMFVVFPLVGNIGDFALFADDEGFNDEARSQWRYDWSHYFSPERLFATANHVLTEGDAEIGLSFIIPSFPPYHTGASVLSGFAFVAVFLAASVLVVRRRNFE